MIAVITPVMFVLIVLVIVFVFMMRAVISAGLPSLIVQIPAAMVLTPFRAMVDIAGAVSYTHLTLPTICSV